MRIRSAPAGVRVAAAPSFGLLGLGIYLILLGTYYAATDGVLMALASATVPEHLRGSGLALLVTATSLAKLVASIAFGALWTAFDAARRSSRSRSRWPSRSAWRRPRWRSIRGGP